MLAKQYRLPAQTRFFQSQTIKTPLFLMRVQSQSLPVSRFGFVVSKKIDKRAVVRNRIKRAFRHIIEQRLENIKGGNDVLFILSANLKTQPMSEVEIILVETLQKAHLLSS